MTVLDALELTADPNDVEASIENKTIGGRTWRNWVSLAAYALNMGITYISQTKVFGPDNTELSAKYQTLVTPAGFAFAIWAIIFIWEGVWTVMQLFEPMASHPAVRKAEVGWWVTCLCQILWTIVFAREVMWLQLLMMYGILAGLATSVLRMDALDLGIGGYIRYRAPFALHMGWIICASLVSTNVFADSVKAKPGAMMTLAVFSIAIAALAAAAFGTAVRTPEPLVPLVVMWALLWINKELGDKKKLNDPLRFNPYAWEDSELAGLRQACVGIAILAAVFAALAAALQCYDFRPAFCRRAKG